MPVRSRSSYLEAIQKAVDDIATNLDAAVQLDRLARRAGLSPFHFHRVFRGMVGETPMEFVRRLRMERAAFRLARTHVSVTQIAFEASYETHEAFTRAFRTWFGAAPSDFRRRKRLRCELPAPSGIHYSPEGMITTFEPRDTGGNTMKVDLIDIPKTRLGAVAHRGPYNEIGRAFERLGALAGPAGLFQQPDAMVVALYYDNPEATPVEQLRSDAAISLPAGAATPNGLHEQTLPAGRYARTLFVGPYEGLGDAWARFMGEWLPASGHRVGKGPSFERYLNMPGQVPKEQLKTEICVPIE